MNVKNKIDFNKKVEYLIENGEFDVCIGAVESFVINFWREELSNEQNLKIFNDWCVEQFKEFDDEE